jgi:virulence factor Mce-like protein
MRIRLIGAAVVVVLAAVAGAILLPTGNESITVTAYFTKAIGLFPQSKVNVLGVKVGRVASVKAEGERVKVVMKIDAERTIPADVRAVIVPISLIADRYVQLTPPYDSGPTLSDGDVIALDHTAIPSELDDVLAQLKKFLDAIEPGTREHPSSLGLAVKNLSSALAGTGDDLSATLGGAGSLSGSIVNNAADVDAIVGELTRLAGALAKRRADIAGLNTNLAQALGAIAQERATLAQGLTSIASLTEELGSLVKAHRAALETDLDVLARTTDAVVRHQDSLIRAVDWLHVLADGAEESHYGGAIHSVPGDHPHIDVRDAHLTACPVGVPASVCLLLGLTGGSMLTDLGLPVPAAASAAPGPGAPAIASPAADPTSLLDLLPSLPLGGDIATQAAVPAASPTPGPVRSFFDRMGGFIDRAFGWFL